MSRESWRVGAVDPDDGAALDVRGEDDWDPRTGRFGPLDPPEGWGDEPDWVERHSW